jgi:hypothetical protein
MFYPQLVGERTLEVITLNQVPINCRLLREDYGELAADVWGRRRFHLYGDVIQFYDANWVGSRSALDPLGLAIGTCGVSKIDRRRQKNGKLKISSYSAKNGEPRIYVRKIASAEVDRIKDWLDGYYAEVAAVETQEAEDYRFAAVKLVAPVRSRPSALARLGLAA